VSGVADKTVRLRHYLKLIGQVLGRSMTVLVPADTKIHLILQASRHRDSYRHYLLNYLKLMGPVVGRQMLLFLTRGN